MSKQCVMVDVYARAAVAALELGLSRRSWSIRVGKLRSGRKEDRQPGEPQLLWQ
jgi:hypothetical protein